MKILQINASYKPAYIYGGPTMSVSQLSEALIKAGCVVQVYTTTANGPNELPVVANNPVMVDTVPVNYFNRITKDHSHFSPGLLKAVWRTAKRFDAIHIHAWWNIPSVLACLIAVMRGVPVIVSPRGTLSKYSFHNKHSYIKISIHYLLTRPLLKKSYIHATSSHEKERLEEVIKPKQAFVIPNFVKLPAEIPFKNRQYDGLLKLLFFSRIEEKKGLDVLINALKAVTVPYHLTIAGSGEAAYINSLKSLAQLQNLDKHISWIGFQSDNKFAIFANHDLLVLPSYDENFGNVIIESLYAGTTVLISDGVGLAAYVQLHNFGYVCRTDPVSIAECINNINPETLSDIKKRAPAIIRRDFNEKMLITKYTDMYNEIITNG